MVISRALFRTRVRRVILPAASILLAGAAMLVGGWLGLIVAGGLLLAAVSFKVAAELAGSLRRRSVEVRALERELQSARADFAALASRMEAVESQLRASGTTLAELKTASVTSQEALVRRNKELGERIDRVLEALQPIRRHRVMESDAMPDLSLQASTDLLLRRFSDRSFSGE